MANSISITGVQTLTAPEDRALLHLSVVVNDQTYDWRLFMPAGQSYDTFLAEKASGVYADIAAKEAAWAALSPKTRTVGDPMSGESMEVAIDKSEVVCPDVPDYYAKRRAEYPALGDQLDAFWKGVESPEYAAMLAKIQAIKAKYPKPA